MKLLKLATLSVLSLLPLTACAVKPPTYSSEQKAIETVEDTAADVKAEVCRGQKPQAITREQYNTWPDDAKAYALANVEQWIAAGCDRLEG